MKKNITNVILYVLISALMCSCASKKKIIYFQDIKDNPKLEAFHGYEPAIKKDDLLSIVVSAPNKDVVIPYNLTLGEGTSSASSVMPYLVDAGGFINFPMLGLLHVEGMTRRQLEQKLTAEIAKDVKDPIVNISFQNYRITILGEVKSPGTYTMTSERTTLLQALGMAGDLSIAGKRNNILLLREKEGGYAYVKIDLRKTDILTSPYFYLNQNDVIYVEPNTARISSGTSPGTIISLVSSAVSLIVSVLVMVL